MGSSWKLHPNSRKASWVTKLWTHLTHLTKFKIGRLTWKVLQEHEPQRRRQEMQHHHSNVNYGLGFRVSMREDSCLGHPTWWSSMKAASFLATPHFKIHLSIPSRYFIRASEEARRKQISRYRPANCSTTKSAWTLGKESEGKAPSELTIPKSSPPAQLPASTRRSQPTPIAKENLIQDLKPRVPNQEWRTASATPEAAASLDAGASP